MAEYECAQCGTLVTGRSGEPDECDDCGHTGFERVRGRSSGLLGLDVGSFVYVCVGMILLVVVAGFAGESTTDGRLTELVTTFGLAWLVVLATLNARRSRVGWLLGFATFGLNGVFVVPFVLVGIEPGDPLTAVIGGCYVLASAAGLLALVGGRGEVW